MHRKTMYKTTLHVLLIESDMLQPRWSLLHFMFFIEEFTNNYILTLFVQYLVLQGATNLRKRKTKGLKVVNSPKDNKERA